MPLSRRCQSQHVARQKTKNQKNNNNNNGTRNQAFRNLVPEIRGVGEGSSLSFVALALSRVDELFFIFFFPFSRHVRVTNFNCDERKVAESFGFRGEIRDLVQVDPSNRSRLSCPSRIRTHLCVIRVFFFPSTISLEGNRRRVTCQIDVTRLKSSTHWRCQWTLSQLCARERRCSKTVL